MIGFVDLGLLSGGTGLSRIGLWRVVGFRFVDALFGKGDVGRVGGFW